MSPFFFVFLLEEAHEAVEGRFSYIRGQKSNPALHLSVAKKKLNKLKITHPQFVIMTYQWQHDKNGGKKKTEVMQKKTATCFFSLSFSSLKSCFFCRFFFFLIRFGESCKMIESDKIIKKRETCRIVHSLLENSGLRCFPVQHLLHGAHLLVLFLLIIIIQC